ncbi:MAG: hypothetical protein ACLFRR_04880 [Spirochaetaceae bacterium]
MVEEIRSLSTERKVRVVRPGSRRCFSESTFDGILDMDQMGKLRGHGRKGSRLRLRGQRAFT